MSKLASTFKLTVGAGKATPQPPVGSALGQRGLKLMDFCKDFNDRTKDMLDNIPIVVRAPPSTMPPCSISRLWGSDSRRSTCACLRPCRPS